MRGGGDLSMLSLCEVHRLQPVGPADGKYEEAIARGYDRCWLPSGHCGDSTTIVSYGSTTAYHVAREPESSGEYDDIR